MENDGKGIFIEGYVNAYIGGSIQAQGNGVGTLSSSNQGDLKSNQYLTAGIYSDSNSNTRLTSPEAATVPENAGAGSNNDRTNNNATAAIGLFGVGYNRQCHFKRCIFKNQIKITIAIFYNCCDCYFNL